MPTAIVAGLPPDTERRVQAALKQQSQLREGWNIVWMRSNSRTPGLAPSQVEPARNRAAETGGAHVLIFRGRDRAEENLVTTMIAPYFRVRWLDHTLPKLIPHKLDEFFGDINQVLDEESEWIRTVKPQDESCCLLLPECAFVAAVDLRHVWRAASEPGLERIRLAARATDRFGIVHWLPRQNPRHKNGPRTWIDVDGRVFNHRGARHGLAPFPRSWKFSYQVAAGFHFDVMDDDSRAFHLYAADGRQHVAGGMDHINIDPHGWVR